MKDIDQPRKLRFPEVAPGRAMHAALVDPTVWRGPGELHSHLDFREVFLVLSGRGTHRVSGGRTELSAGDLVLIRPSDVHGYRVGPGQELAFINVAFPESTWSAFLGLAEVTDAWQSQATPPTWSLGPVNHGRAEGIFRQALTDFQNGGRAMHLTRFLGALLPLMHADSAALPRADLPPWLSTAMSAMERTENVAVGLPRFVELSGVSLPHLCRTMRARTGQSPTEFLNDLRVRNAATLLATTHLNLSEIADRCGFESLSYLHRQFRARMGMPPLAYRRVEGSRIVTG